MGDSAAIQVEGLTKRYGTVHAVNGLSFAIAAGEIVGFLGPNGAGKSTTMRIITAFLPATSGTARVAGYDVAADSLKARRNIGYLPEGVPLYPEMRVSEYLDFRARIKGVPRRQRAAQIQQALRDCNILDVAAKLIGGLSKGYRQRVGLADALLGNPPILILDEPTIGLDPNQIRQMRQLIRELGGARTILLSTHILPEVEMVCDRVLIINRGKLAFAGNRGEAGWQTGPSRLIAAVRGPGESVRAALAVLPEVAEVSWNNAEPAGCFTVTPRPGQDARAAVSRCVVRNNEWELLELRAERPALEDVFFRLTMEEA